MNIYSFKRGDTMPKTKAQCEKIRSTMKKKILDSALIYFARNGYSGTKINDLAKFIEIGQGTLYSYFSSKEELFKAILDNIVNSNEQDLLKLKNAPISASHKISMLSNNMIKLIKNGSNIAYTFVLNMQYSIENNFNNQYSKSYEEKPNQILSEIISEGQKEGTVIGGNPLALANLYWDMIHMIAFKKVFNTNHEIIGSAQLARLLLKDT